MTTTQRVENAAIAALTLAFVSALALALAAFIIFINAATFPAFMAVWFFVTLALALVAAATLTVASLTHR